MTISHHIRLHPQDKVAPISEEILKIAVPIMILEHKAKTIRNRSDLLHLAAGSGLVFAIAENLLYMIGYSMSPGILAWRWLACTAMHVGASSLAGVGLMRAFDRASRTGEAPRFIWEWPWLLAATARQPLQRGTGDTLHFDWVRGATP